MIVNEIPFIKMTALGNDYIYVVDMDFELEGVDFSELARDVSDRHFGIGSDGLVIINDSDEADCSMRIFNSDGSEAEMCGNALRCVGLIAYGSNDTRTAKISTLSGIKTVKCSTKGGFVKANMGQPVIVKELNVAGFNGDIVDVGNPHYVVYDDSISDEDFEKRAEALQHDPNFPNGVNVERARVKNKKNIECLVYERGSGMTLACGTGATALFWSCYKRGLVDSKVNVKLPGGTLVVEKLKSGVTINGEVSTIATGVYIWSQNG